MTTTLDLVSGENEDYGSTYDDEDLVVPFRQPPSRRRPFSWKTKKVVLGIIGVMLAVVGAGATVFWSVLTDSSLAQTGQSFLLQLYPYVKITNMTPYYVRPQGGDNDDRDEGVSYLACRSDFIQDGLPAVWMPGTTWTASSRGLCLVHRIYVDLIRPDLPGGFLECAPYTSTGTAYSIYSIRMDGEDACCVLSSHETQKCPPKSSKKKWKKKRMRRIRSAMKSKSVLQKTTIPSEDEGMN